MDNDFLLIVLVTGFVFGLIGGYIAGEKNRSGLEGFLFGFFLSIIGLIIIGILPTIDKKVQEKKEKTPEEITRSKALYEKSKRNEKLFIYLILGIFTLGVIISIIVGAKL